MMDWPVGSGRVLETGAIISTCMETFKGRGKDIEGSLVKVLKDDPTPSGAARAVQNANDAWSEMERTGYRNREEAMGIRTFFIMADRGTEGILRFVKALEECDGPREVLLEKANAMLSEGLSGRKCPIDLTEMSPEDRSALRNVWRTVTSVRH
jgi:hypothetical protein